MRISTNVSAMRANREIENVSREKTTTLGRISSGERICHASDDPAGLAISEKMKARSRGNEQAQRNANDAISFIQVAEGSLGTLQDLSVRLKELALYASNNTGDKQGELIGKEFNQLKDEMKRVISTTEFNGQKLLDGGSRYDMQIGIDSNLDSRIVYDLTQSFESLSRSPVQNTDVTNIHRARSALDVIDKSMLDLATARAKLGAIQNRMGAVISNLEISNENLLASKSRIRDADIAKESALKVREEIRSETSTAYLVHSLDASKVVLKLLS